MLLQQGDLDIGNHWRARRGEPTLTMLDVLNLAAQAENNPALKLT